MLGRSREAIKDRKRERTRILDKAPRGGKLEQGAWPRSSHRRNEDSWDVGRVLLGLGKPTK